MKSYATYVRGEGYDRATSGLLTVSEDGIRFESFPQQTALEKIFPLAAREPDPKISWFYPRSVIVSLSDLKGRRFEPPGVVGWVLRSLQVEPNGLIVHLETHKVIFDCAISVYRIIAAYEGTTS